jgi:hypothetical protein
MNPSNSPTPSAPANDTGTGGGATQSGALADTKNKIVQTARDTAAKVKETASTTASRAREEAERFATERKETTANRIGDYSSAIHDSARSLEEKDPNIAWFSHRAADKLQSVADYVRTRDFASLRRDAEDVARRHPAVFFGGMFLAGLILGNVMKASRRKADDTIGFDDDTTDWSGASTESMTQSDLTAAERAAAGI